MTTELDQSQPVTTEASPTETPKSTPNVDITPAATTVDWLGELEKADPKLLRSHPKIAGMIGSEIQRARQEENERISREANARAAKAAEEQMLKLAQEDPVTFAEKYLTEYEQNKIRTQLDTVKGVTRQELAASIGRAFNEIPEWAELDTKDHETLAKALMGKDEDEIIPIFINKASDLIVEKRAAKKHEQWKSKELPKEREALRQEEAAKLLKSSEGPDVTPPKRTPAAFDPRALPEKDFNDWWDKGKL